MNCQESAVGRSALLIDWLAYLRALEECAVQEAAALGRAYERSSALRLLETALVAVDRGIRPSR